MPNWFAQGGDAYARHRPDYPPELAAFLSGLAPDRGMAADIGCGSGQFTRLLADRFAEVVGIDPSADQLAHAARHPRIRYIVAPAEALPLPAGCAALVTAAQAAHWFDRDAFYAEARRIAAPDAVLALISYGVPVCDTVIGPRFDRFYRDEIGPFWPPERALVESGYKGIAFPFAEIAYPDMAIVRDWNLADLLGYVDTWSATRRAGAAGPTILARFAAELAALWGDREVRRQIYWPITMLLGRI